MRAPLPQADISDDDGDTWSAETTLVVSGGQAWKGNVPILCLRDDNPVVIYSADAAKDVGVREWNGSSWDAEVQLDSTPEGYIGWSSAVQIGTTLYIAFNTVGYPRGSYLTTWNGTSLSAPEELAKGKVAETQIGTNGVDLFISYSDDEDQGTNPSKHRIYFMIYDVSSGKRRHNSTMVSNPTTDYIWPSFLPQYFASYPMFVYPFRVGATKELHSIYYNLDYGVKITLDGYDISTKPDSYANIRKFSLISSIPLLKIKASAKVTIANGAISTIAHGLSYPPIVWVFLEDGSGHLVPVYDNTSSTYMYVDYTNLVIRNSEGAARNFYYYIFHDEM